MSHVLDFYSYITEELSRDEWLNYKDDTYLALDKPRQDTELIAQKIKSLLGTDDAADIQFTGNDIGLGENFKHFHLNIIPKSEVDGNGALTFDEYTAYYTLYTYNDMKYVSVDVKDIYEHSYIFIKSEDLKKIHPEWSEEEETEEKAPVQGEAQKPAQ